MCILLKNIAISKFLLKYKVSNYFITKIQIVCENVKTNKTHLGCSYVVSVHQYI